MMTFMKGIKFKKLYHSGAQQEDEPDRPPVKVTTLIVLLSFLFLALVAFIASILLWKATTSREKVVNLGMGNETRIEYMKKENEKLNSYEKLDNGNYQVPVSQEMETIIRENQN